VNISTKERNALFQRREGIIKQLFSINGVATNYNPIHRLGWQQLIDAFVVFNQYLDPPEKVIVLVVVVEFRSDHADAPPHYLLEEWKQSDDVGERMAAITRHPDRLVHSVIDIRRM
jgi:hypothetical protein